MKRKKGYYSISVVAKMFSVHQQTVRMYEKEGLITPKRSSGNTRLFSEEDVDRLEEIIRLTHELGVNLAGVEIILKLQKKIKKLQDEINKLFDATQGQLEKENEELSSVVKKRAGELIDMKKRVKKMAVDISEQSGQYEQETDSPESDAPGEDEWHIDYNE